MYKQFFGVPENPFAITPDPRYLYMSAKHQEALAHLLYGIGDDGGFALLSGEVGTGKTTVCRYLLDHRPSNVDFALCLNPRLNEIELLANICDELGIDYPDGSTSLKEYIDRLNRHLLKAHAEGRQCVLIIDEAQDLSPEVLEQVRLLTNLETTKHKLLRIILIGQPELNDLLDREDLRQLAQRITARYHLEPLDRKNATALIHHRMSVAGLKREVFSNAAIAEIFRISGGVPRIINNLCDRCLLAAYAENKKRVDKRIVRTAALEVLSPKQRRKSQPAGWLPWAAGFLLVAAGGVAGLAMTPQGAVLKTQIREMVETGDYHWPDLAIAATVQPRKADPEPGKAAPEPAQAAPKPTIAAAPAPSAAPKVEPAASTAPAATPQVSKPPENTVMAAKAPAPAIAPVAGQADRPEEPKPAVTEQPEPVGTTTDTAAAEPDETPQTPSIVSPQVIEKSPSIGMPSKATANPEPTRETAAATQAPPEPVKQDAPKPAPPTAVVQAVAETPPAVLPTQAAPASATVTAQVPAPASPQQTSRPTDQSGGSTDTVKMASVEREIAPKPPADLPSDDQGMPSRSTGLALGNAQQPPAASAPATGQTQAALSTGQGTPDIAATGPAALFVRGNGFGGLERAFQSLFAVWQRDYTKLEGFAPCTKAQNSGLQCHQGRGTWWAVQRLNRPTLITLSEPGRQQLHAVVTAIAGETASLTISGEQFEFDINDLTPYWSGHFLLLWQPPKSFSRMMKRGMRGRDVAWLRDRMAELNGQAGGGSEIADFDQDLWQQVLAFQSSRNLSVDGLVGPRTLIHLNSALAAATTPFLQRRNF